MQNEKILKFGFITFTNWVPLLNSSEKIQAFLSHKGNDYGQIAITLADYLVNHKKAFDKVTYMVTGVPIVLREYINKSKVDIAPKGIEIREKAAEFIDFAYPFQLHHSTFTIRKPEYKPQIFGIFQTFSLSIWIAIISVLIALMIIYYITLRWKYSFDKIFLHVFAVLLRQSLIFKPSSVAENVLVYSWVIGAMCLCLAYDSVFLSFLAIPPVVEINNVAQLAMAVEKGDYSCIYVPTSLILEDLLQSKVENFRIIGKNLNKSNLLPSEALETFFSIKKDRNLAFIGQLELVDAYGAGDVVVGKETFLDIASAMGMRKDFCCKKLIETFVHRLMASGLYFKFRSDNIFHIRLRIPFQNVERDPKRILTLTDVAPAFIFLLTGYVISFLIFIQEILSYRRKGLSATRITRKRKNSMQ